LIRTLSRRPKGAEGAKVSVVAVPYAGESEPMGSHANPHLERGIAFKLDGRYDEAVAEFQLLLSDDPNSSDGHHQLGLVYGFIGMFDESLEELQHAVTLAPARIDVRNDLALTYSMLGMYDEAKSEFEDVLRRDPNNKRALESMEFLSEPS
jgi:tetratricopeptide (TPR) repeat protein